MQAFAIEHELEIAAGEGLFGRPIALRFPVAAIPQLDRAAAILALRDGPFEVAIIQAGDLRPRPRAVCPPDPAMGRASPPKT